MANGGKAKRGWAIGAAALAMTAAACGVVASSDVVSARQQATTASCAYYQRCDQIGAGQPGGDTPADCTTTVEGKWTSAWSTSQCQDHIAQDQLTVCLNAIGATTDCSGVGALFALAKCSANSVCSKNVPPADAATD